LSNALEASLGLVMCRIDFLGWLDTLLSLDSSVTALALTVVSLVMLDLGGGMGFFFTPGGFVEQSGLLGVEVIKDIPESSAGDAASNELFGLLEELLRPPVELSLNPFK